MDTESKRELSIFPLIYYDGCEWQGLPCFKTDPATHLQRIRNFESRSDDILLCTATKSGSFWLHEIISMLVEHTTEYNSRDATFNTHLDGNTDFTYLENESKRRIIHTHFPYNYIPKKHIDLGGKIIYLNRNPKDRYVSQYCFWKRLRGCPSSMYLWEKFFDYIKNDKFHGGWWKYTREWSEAQKTNDNILPVMYEGLKLNPRKEIARIADFIGVSADETFIAEVAFKTEFEQLKLRKKDSTVDIAHESKSNLFRKGIIGDWKNFFTVAQNEEFDAIYEQEMAGVDIKFVYENP